MSKKLDDSIIICKIKGRSLTKEDKTFKPVKFAYPNGTVWKEKNGDIIVERFDGKRVRIKPP